MKGVFITGTDTGVGKTVVCGMLGRYLANRRCKVIIQKWIQTGSKSFPADIDLHLRLMKRRRKDIKDYFPYVSVYTFRFAASPHLAASMEKRRIKIEKIKESFRFLSERFDFVVIEGIGGALVPFNKKSLLIDIAKELDLPVLIIVANKLGAINHALLTIEAIKRRNMKIIGIIFNNQSKKANKIILRDNPQIIKSLTGERILGVLPWFKDKELLYNAFMSIGKKVLTRLRKR